MEATATKFAWPLPAIWSSDVPVAPYIEYVVDAISNAGLWTIAFTILSALIAYDQSESVVLQDMVLYSETACCS